MVSSVQSRVGWPKEEVSSDASRHSLLHGSSTCEAMPLTERFTILAFKAGRAFRRDGTNIIEPSATKGAIVVEKGEDDELHFMWKNRETEETVEARLSQFWCNSS
jgi:proteasome complex subunit Rpn13 ubiquitin receptor